MVTLSQVYTLTLLSTGVPSSIVAQYKPYLSNMVGLIRGNMYYNLMSWYRCLACLPIGDTSKFMESMMGVKQVGYVECCVHGEYDGCKTGRMCGVLCSWRV